MYVHIVVYIVYVCVCVGALYYLYVYYTYIIHVLGIMDGDGFSTAVYCRATRHWRNASHVLRIDPREPQQIDVQIVGGASMELLICCCFIVLFLRGRLFHGICGVDYVDYVDFGKISDDQWWSVHQVETSWRCRLGSWCWKVEAWLDGTSMEHGGDGGVKLLLGTLRSGVFGADGHVYCPPWCSRRVPPGSPLVGPFSWPPSRIWHSNTWIHIDILEIYYRHTTEIL